MSRFLILLDYKKRFLTSIENLHDYAPMKVDRVRELLEEYGHSVEIMRFSELDLNKSYKDYCVLYHSAEDIGVFYKNYIEDIIYYLEMQGAIVLPKYTYLLAHHNKCFMELLRKSFKFEGFKTINSRVYGTAEDAIEQTNTFPVLIKSAEGRGSNNVFLARNKEDFTSKVKKISGVFILNDLSGLKEFIINYSSMKLINKVRTKYRYYTFYRKKFIVQDFIQGLQGDYKVLFFGGKYFFLYRKNRDNDFRASGSGKFFVDLEDNELQGLIDFASHITEEIDFPIISMDIGYDGQNYHLFEFQCVHIGPYALQASPFWYEKVDGKWMRFEGRSNLEVEFCRSINDYVQKIMKK